MDIYEAIEYRRWTKTFELDELSAIVLNGIKSYCNHLNRIDETANVSVTIKSELAERKRNQRLGLIRGLIRPPYYIMIHMDTMEQDLVEAGYLMGQISLYLTSRGIGCCFLGVERIPADKQGGKAHYAAVLGFGRTKEKIATQSKKVRNIITEKHCVFKGDIDSNIKKIVMYGGYCPIHLIYQPYRFLVIANRIHIFVKKEAIITKYQQVLFQIELGILLANMQVKTEELWLDFTVKKLDEIGEKPMKQYQYFTTAIID